MSSGSLPLSTYHRASALGEGSYGSVMTVYDDDGNEFALKLFYDDDDDDDDDDDGSDEEYEPDGTLDIGALREISALRLFRCENGHPNVVSIADVKSIECDEDEELAGAGTAGCIGIAMPLFHGGTATSAINSGSLRPDRAAKVGIAHGLLSAVAFLHENGVIHRDIKGDNIMLVRREDDDDDGGGPSLRPVLIDFSLAKLFSASMYGRGDLVYGFDDETTHTPECGTPTYRAPEVVAREPYGPAADLWSVGVVLLELIQGATLRAEKDRGAERLIEEAKSSLPDQPFPNLVRRLLEEDPDKRPTAREALKSPLFEKFGLSVDERTYRTIKLHKAFSLYGVDDADGTIPQSENGKRLNGSNGISRGSGKCKIDPAIVRRMKTIQRLCSHLACSHPLTRQAALCYSRPMEQLDDALDDIRESQALMDCVVLAARFFEKDLPHLHELDECDRGDFANWTLEAYRDNESTIWMMMDFCLYPRKLENWSV